MTITYKQKCARCNKNYVLATWKKSYLLCYDCQKKELEGKISDPKMKKLFDIPEKLYEESAFLRNIKINYLKFGNLSPNQIDTFKRVADEMQGKKPKEDKDKKPKSKRIAK